MSKAILQVCGYAAPYAGNFISTLLALAEKNKEIGFDTVFAFPVTAAKLEWCKELEQKYRVYYLPLRRARINPKTYFQMRRIYRENNISIAHSHFELYDMSISLMAPSNVKVFWHLHDALDLIYQKSGKLYRILWKYQYKHASKGTILLSVSEKGKRFAIHLGFDPARAFFLPNGINTNRIDKTVYNATIEKRDFLIYGWDFRRKGVDVLLEVLSGMQEQFICALVAGEDTWAKIEREKYKQLVEQPSVENVAALYRSSKCFLHVSRQEGLSYALLEAIYSGCAVICSDIEENLFAKVFPTVRFVKVEDVEDLRQAMRGVLNNQFCPTETEIAKSREIIVEEYSLATWIKRVQEYYFV